MAVNQSTEAAVQALEEAGPAAHGDPMGTPSAGEQIVWKGRPDLSVLARTAFHTRSVGIYFVILIAVSALLGNVQTAVTCTVLALLAQLILYTLAWVSRRTTLYILTDTRLIMRIGMAMETRVNIPLKHVTSASLRRRSADHGDIALQLSGERTLGYVLLWPHARPWRFSMPEPMLRAVPEAQMVAERLAEAAARHTAIERNLTSIKDAKPSRPQGSRESGPVGGFNDGDLEGAHA